jgi:hypothetical protein
LSATSWAFDDHLGDDEIVVGRDNKHLDFRLAVLKFSTMLKRA